ncbi:MAG TPA: efflux RND transporter periplasmic adaptor subunit [Oscillospiraceae bacterium]|nr:efflux RND transporter periplasmic adaptor subunit [Oscillospiraceae bacterium]
MKKYVMLFIFTLVAVTGVIIAGTFFKNSIVAVNVVKVEPLTVENAVTCTGRVERTKTTNVYVKTSCLVKTVYVNVGDQVKAGQPLMSITTYQSDSASSASSPAQQAYENYINAQASSSSSSSSLTSESKEEDVLAPEAGEITSISAERLTYAYPSKAAMTIANNSNLQIRLSVNESQVSDIRVGQKASITGVGFKSTYSGKVKSISSGAKQVDTTTGQDTVIDVIISVDNPNADIKPGFTAKARIVTSTTPNVLIAPYEAVRADNTGNEYVFKLNGSTAVKVPVKTNREFDNGFEIKSGLSKNDKIVLNPDNISNGTFVLPSVKGTVQAHD